MASLVLNSKIRGSCFYTLAAGSIGTKTSINAASFGVLRLPTDPIGTFTLSLTNLALNSAIQVQAQDGTPIYNGTADTSTKILNLQAYAPGSPLNDLIIKVRKGSSAPYYQPWSTQTTAIKGSQTIFVSQIPDE